MEDMMKSNKILRTILVLLVVVLISGCSGNQSHEVKERTKEVREPAETENIELTPVLELGELDTIPINFQDEGWIIQQNGKYGFVNSDGEMIVEPKYENANLTIRSDNDKRLDMAYLYHEEIEPTVDALLPNDHVPNPNLGYGIGGTASMDAAFLTDTNEIIYYNPYTQKEVPALTVLIEKPSVVYPMGTSREAKNKTDYYVWDPNTNKISDRISSNSYVSYLHKLMDKNFNGWNSSIGCFFWIPDGEGASLVNLKNERMITGFDSAMAVDLTTILGKKKDWCYVYDYDLVPLYSGEFEAGAAPLNDLVPIQQDKEWKIVSLKDLKKKYSDQESNFEKVKIPEDNSLFHKLGQVDTSQTDQEAVSSQTDLESNLAGDYVHTSGVGAWGDELTVDQSGHFEGFCHDSDYDGVMYSAYSGDFTDFKQEEDLKYSATVKNIKREEADLERYAEAPKVEETELSPDLKDGNRISIFLKGYPLSKLTEMQRMWIQPIYSSSGSSVLEDTYIFNEDQERGFFSYTK